MIRGRPNHKILYSKRGNTNHQAKEKVCTRKGKTWSGNDPRKRVTFLPHFEGLHAMYNHHGFMIQLNLDPCRTVMFSLRTLLPFRDNFGMSFISVHKLKLIDPWLVNYYTIKGCNNRIVSHICNPNEEN